MTPKEKAKELVEKMYLAHSNSVSEITHHLAKQCALIAADEVTANNFWKDSPSDVNYLEYWYNVKQEIEKL